MYRIGEFSTLVGLSVSTLRHYEKIGILVPGRTDPENQYCYYDGNNYLQAVLISGMKEMGFTLNEIKSSMDLRKDADLYNAIIRKKEKLIKERQRLDGLLEEIEEYLLLYGGEKNEVE